MLEERNESQADSYYWVETLIGPDGDVLHRGQCGAPNETTKVVTELTAPPELAVTGSDNGGMWALGIGAGVAILAAAGVLLFGRRLAQQRDEADGADDEDAEVDRKGGDAIDTFMND